MPPTQQCLACINLHKANFSQPSVQSIPCSYDRAVVLCGGSPAPPPSPPSNVSKTVYVSAIDGEDSNTGGSPSSPLRSLADAVTLAAEIHATKISISGTFNLNRTATFTAQHAGLVVEQWAGKPPAILSGGLVLPNAAWTKGSDGVWTTLLPATAATALTATGSGAIFVNGNRRLVSRTPTLKWSAPLGAKNSKESKRGFVYAKEGGVDPFEGWNLDAAHLADWRVGAFHRYTVIPVSSRVSPHACLLTRVSCCRWQLDQSLSL
jgi:hypothetical protein